MFGILPENTRQFALSSQEEDLHGATPELQMELRGFAFCSGGAATRKDAGPQIGAQASVDFEAPGTSLPAAARKGADRFKVGTKQRVSVCGLIATNGPRNRRPRGRIFLRGHGGVWDCQWAYQWPRRSCAAYWCAMPSLFLSWWRQRPYQAEPGVRGHTKPRMRARTGTSPHLSSRPVQSALLKPRQGWTPSVYGVGPE